MTARELAAMLAEQSPHFSGLGSNDAERRRREILDELEASGVPPEAEPLVLEELETGRDPRTVAAAARALRAAPAVAAEAPALLVGAIARLRGEDDVVSFEDGRPVTALGELARTLAHLGPRARSALPALAELDSGDGFSPAVRGEIAAALAALARADSGCCHTHAVSEIAAPRATSHGLAGLGRLALEDQDGTRLDCSQAFSGRPTALAFFYTRCTNPEKCSLTVTRLGLLARGLGGLDANVAGMTYDPAFDRPERLKAYGSDRGVEFSERCRLLRTVGPFEPVREALDLGVGYGPVTVNRHRLELVVLDASLGTVRRFERRLWHEDAVLEALRSAAG